MPSERMDSQGLSPSSFFSAESQLTDERSLGFWKSNTGPNHGVASSPLGKQMALEPQIGKNSDFLDSYLNQDLRTNLLLQKHVAGAAGAASRSLPRALEHELGARPNFSVNPASYSVNGDRLNLIGAQCENGLFSSSLSELFSRKLRLSSNNSSHGRSVGAAASQYEEDEPFQSLKELEAHTIGNLLPDDDDDLFSGVTEGMEQIAHRYNGDDTEHLDVFSNVGGMDLGDDGLPSGQMNSQIFGGSSNGNISIGGEHPFGEHPSRTLFVRNINSNIEDSEIRSLFEQFGDVRALHTACKHRGFVMVSYYDIRAARNAMKALQNKSLQQRKLDIHFSIPKDNPSDKDINQGTLVVFNLDTSVSNDELHQLFGVYGEIKEIRGTPNRSDHKFIEFYDVRAAAAALRELNRHEIAGKRIKIEPSRPGGARRLMQPYLSESDHDDSGLFSHGGIAPNVDKESLYGSHAAAGSALSGFIESSFNHVKSPNVPNGLPSPIRAGSVGHHQSGINESGHSRGELKLDLLGMQNFHPHSLPDAQDRWSASGFSCNSPNRMSSSSLTSVPSDLLENQQFCRLSSNGPSLELKEAFYGPGNGSCPPSGRHYIWNNTHHPQPQGMMWPNSPSFVNGVSSPHPQQLHVVPRSPNQLLAPLLPLTTHHVGSAPPVNPSLWDRQHAYSGESPEASMFLPGSLGNARISGNSSHPLEYVSRNVFPGGGGSCIDVTAPKNVAFNSHPQRCMVFPARGQMIPVMNAFDSPNERIRNRRNENLSNQVDNKRQFELDIERIARGEDKRTTLMIKNIPNKYTSKMLLAAIDERHRGTYDFLYLPIDFKNKCNVGYAFINMTDPSLIIPFYQVFNGKKWEKFNSEKVASIAYARIQGKAALIAHFQNSSLMNEDKRCRPILFHTDGPNAGDQVPFPMGVNVRPRFGKIRTSTNEDNNSQESPMEGGECSSGETTFGSKKESN